MENHITAPMHRKRKRRRRLNKPPKSGHLLLDERMKDEVGVLSEDLFADLFPDRKDEIQDRVHHVAITPWMPLTTMSTDSTPWTILPVRCGSKLETSSKQPQTSLRFSANALALQSFAHALRSLSPNRTLQKRDAPIEIRISDVVPPGLDTVYVKLDMEALKKLEDVHAKFGGGFGAQQAAKGRLPKVDEVTERLARDRKYRDAIKAVLRSPRVVHANDLLPLPLPAHPITHVSAPPARIVACEPVSQGLVLPSTRIVILPGKSSKASETSMKAIGHRKAQQSLSNGIPEEDEDTSNEQFFSAAEDIRTGTSTPANGESSFSDTEASVTDADDLSDDAEDIITLSAPGLSQTSGVLTQSIATPRPGHPNGIATPGSIYSSFSVATVKGAAPKSKTFKAFGLLDHLPDELLHPRPGPEDDDEARVFVDTAAFVKLGCFSGDWVRVEAASDAMSGFGQWTLASFGRGEDEDHEWRVARIYGLPEFMSKKDNRFVVHKTDEHPLSLLSGGGMLPPTTSVAHVSPIILANLGSPTHLKISALSYPVIEGHLPPPGKKGKVAASTNAPSAKEVTLLKLSTPLSSERALQPSLFAGLKDFFEHKRRLVKQGDLVGIPVDESLSKAVFEGGNAEDSTTDEVLSRTRSDSKGGEDSLRIRLATGVAWFKIGDISSNSKEDDDHDVWGGVMSIDASNTKMVQAGSEQGKVPETTSSTWPYYLGLKKPYIAERQGPGSTIISTDLPTPYVSTLRRRLRELISAAASPRAIHLGLPPVAVLLTSTQRNIGKSTTAEQACADLGLHTFAIDAYDILTEGGDSKTEAFLKARAERALACGKLYTALLVKHVEKLDAERMVTAMKEILSDSRVLIATTTDIDKVPEGIRSLFTHELEMTAPDEAEREGILRGVVENTGLRTAPDVSLSSVAVKTAALVAGDLVDVVDRAMLARQIRLNKLAQTANKTLASGQGAHAEQQVSVKDLMIAGHPVNLLLTAADFTTAVDAARKNFADSIGAPKIPNVQWSDVGGLSHVKSAVIETIQLPLSRPELFARGMKKRSGILFYGPPGTGKTLLAKAIATEFSLNFFSVKGPELLNMYIGESEANVRRVFQRARDARPCVVFFDELDSVAPKRGNQGDSGGVMDRIVSQLLAELDGMSGDGDGEDGAAGGGQGVFVIGATNRPDLLDQALLRPGRFDKMLYLGVNDTHEGQLKVLEALSRKFTLYPSCSLSRIAATLPFTYTGADLYALCSDAMLKAITRQARQVDTKVSAYNQQLQITGSSQDPISIAYFFDHLATEEDIQVTVMEEDFEHAHAELVPSVSREELEHYDRVRRAFEGSTTAAGAAKKLEAEDLSVQMKGLMPGEVRPPLPPEPINSYEPVRRSGSWVKQAKDRLKARSSSRGRGGGSSGGGTVQAGNRRLDMRKMSSDSPESTYGPSSTNSSSLAGDDADEDDYVIKTDHLRTNGIGHKAPKGKGKGRGDSGFGDAADEDEDMYA